MTSSTDLFLSGLRYGLSISLVVGFSSWGIGIAIKMFKKIGKG